MRLRPAIITLLVLVSVGLVIGLLNYEQDREFYSHTTDDEDVPNFKIEKNTAGINPLGQLKRTLPAPTASPPPVPTPVKKQENVEEKKESGEGLHIEGNLFLARALDVRRNHLVIGVLQVEGRAEIKNGVAFLSGLVLHKGTDRETEVLNVEGAVLNSYGYFKYEHPKHEDIMGIVNVQQKEGGAKVRFSNGPLANAHLDFVNSEKYSELTAKQGSGEYAEVSSNGFALPGDEIIVNGFFRPEYLPYVKEPNLNKEQMRSIASEIGFSF